MMGILGESAEGQRLRKVANKVDEMRKQRCQLIERLRMDLDDDDITKKALTERELDPGKLFELELKKHDKNRELIEQNLRAQENILKALTEANANFADYRRQIVATNER
jgi:tyrosine-protein phosphatase non-receptor type 23